MDDDDPFPDYPAAEPELTELEYAERAVLGAMMLDPRTVTDVIEFIDSPGVFYQPRHGTVFEAITTLHRGGDPTELVAVSRFLTESGDLARVGGAVYLHTLLGTPVTAANAGYYARMVADAAVVRDVAAAMQRGLRAAEPGIWGQPAELIDMIAGDLAKVRDHAGRRRGPRLIEPLVEAALDASEAAGKGEPDPDGAPVPTGLLDLDDVLSGGVRPGALVTVAARPGVGKTILGAQWAAHAALKLRIPTLLFSLEMGEQEIAQRLVANQAGIPLDRLIKGELDQREWGKVAAIRHRFSEAPLWIEDDPHVTVGQIHAVAKRHKAEHGLGLVVVDYLQLMQTPARTESRQQAVADMSRAMKLAAKDLAIPVVQMSQLNRGPESRQDGKPMVSDMRESGCMTADTTLMRADTGAPITFGELMTRGASGVSVWSLDENRRMVAAPVTNVFSSGVKQVFRLRLASGREVKASGNHKFLSFAGWVALDDLNPGDRVAVPRRTPAPIVAEEWNTDEVLLLAHMLGDGSALPRQPLRYASIDEANLAAVSTAAERRFGVLVHRDEYAAARVTTLRFTSPHPVARGRRNPMVKWLDGLGVYGLRSHEKVIPDGVYGLPDEQVALFLRHLWATDGSVGSGSASSPPSVYYATTSRRLADGVVLLLSRFGIVARLRQVQKPGYLPGYHVGVSGGDLMTFCREVGVHGARGVQAARLAERMATRARHTNVDSIPREVWAVVKSERIRVGLTERQFQAAIGTNYCGSALYRARPSRERLLRCADALGSDALRAVATDDVFWDQVVGVIPLGSEPVFDATVKGPHNFVADGIVAHNSIEQDSDVVILMHRPENYIRDEEERLTRAGEVAIDVAKHRAGRTGSVVCAWQGHYVRIADIARVSDPNR